MTNMLVSQPPGAQSKPISLPKQQMQMEASTRKNSPSPQAAMRALKMGNRYFHRENYASSSINSSFSLNTLYFIKRLKTHRDHASAGREKSKCALQNVKGGRCRDRKQDGHCSCRIVRQQEALPVHSIIAQFSSPYLSPVRSENK